MRSKASIVIMLCLIIVCTFALSGCSTESYDNMMGTFISLSLHGGNVSRAEREIYDMISDVENHVSTNIASSTVSRINSAKAGETIELDIHTSTMLYRAYEAYTMSGGAFDMSIFPLVKLWKFSPDTIDNNEKEPPADGDIERILSSVIGFDKAFKLNREEGKITKLIDGAMLDLGAVAKGYVADRAKEILTRNNVKKAIVNIGGTLYLHGDKSYVVGITNPRQNGNNEDIIDKINVNSRGVSTSGDYERYYMDSVTGERYHHIIDPKTGRPANREYCSVTIIANSAMDTDILSTAVYVLGERDGLELIRQFDSDAEVIFIKSDGKVADITRYRDGEIVDHKTI